MTSTLWNLQVANNCLFVDNASSNRVMLQPTFAWKQINSRTNQLAMDALCSGRLNHEISYLCSRTF